MLRFLKRKLHSDEGFTAPSIGPDRRVYAIGDIHGRADLFARLLGMVADDDAARDRLPLHIILLGDLVDRGPRSAQVIEQALTLSQAANNVHFIKGNHEEVFVMAARGDPRAARFFCRIGGVETLASYGLDEVDCADMEEGEIAQWMLTHIPRGHVDFVDGFEDMIEMGDYLFVHAGIRPRVPLDAQDPNDLRWIRGEFLDWDAPFGPIVIHGHSITESVDERSNRIGIDTGAYYSNRLTAIGLQADKRWFLSTAD
jgi:serine/threonine protein phosphatase 1